MRFKKICCIVLVSASVSLIYCASARVANPHAEGASGTYCGIVRVIERNADADSAIMFLKVSEGPPPTGGTVDKLIEIGDAHLQSLAETGFLWQKTIGVSWAKNEQDKMVAKQIRLDTEFSNCPEAQKPN